MKLLVDGKYLFKFPQAFFIIKKSALLILIHHFSLDVLLNRLNGLLKYNLIPHLYKKIV